MGHKKFVTHLVTTEMMAIKCVKLVALLLQNDIYCLRCHTYVLAIDV